MKKVILTKGIPACGKTTWALEQIEKTPGRYKRVNKDDLRAMIDGGKWSKSNEQFILKVRNAFIFSALQAGYHVIVDDTNLHEKHLQDIRELVKGVATVEIQDFTDVPLETCIERDRNRPNYVGEQVIRKMHRDFLQPKPPIIEHNPDLPDAIICDLDGTIALMNGRSPYDTAKCMDDLLNKPIADIALAFAKQGLTILFTSGRKDTFRTETTWWLGEHGFAEFNEQCFLFMRNADDNRKDAIVKQEMYEQHIKGRYNVRFVLDDRNQVVELWRSLGLTCLQVADGDY